MEEFKVRILNKEHCERVQDALFEMGYEWGCFGCSYYDTTYDVDWLFGKENGYITYAQGEEWGEACEAPEYILHNGKLIPRESSIVESDVKQHTIYDYVEAGHSVSLFTNQNGLCAFMSDDAAVAVIGVENIQKRIDFFFEKKYNREALLKEYHELAMKMAEIDEKLKECK